MSIKNESKLKQCEYCSSMVRKDNYNRHLKKMHYDVLEQKKQRDRIKVRPHDDSKVQGRIKRKCDRCGEEANRPWIYYNFSGIETTDGKLYLYSGCNKEVRNNSKDKRDPLDDKIILRIRE